MAWIIDRDYYADKSEPAPCNANAVGMTGPNMADHHVLQRLRENPRYGVKFRMYDDDGNLYYAGRISPKAADLNGFQPLDNFGTPNAGCTEIRYYNAATHCWETL